MRFRDLVIGAAVATLTPVAALAGQVTLTSPTGGMSVSGELLDFSDGVYTVGTVLGPLQIEAGAVECTGPGCPAPQPVVMLTEARIGERVELSVESDTIRISGTLRMFHHQTYTIETALGTFTVPAAGTVCDGPGCPVPTPVDPAAIATRVTDLMVMEAEPQPADDDPLPLPGDIDIRIVAPDDIVSGLFPALAQGFADLSSSAVVRRAYPATDGTGPDGMYLELRADADRAPQTTLLGQSATPADSPVRVLAEGGADVVFMTGEAGAADQALTTAEQARVVALDGLVAIVAPQNPLARIAIDDLRAVLVGSITNWAALGGADAPITVHAVPQAHDTARLTRDLLLGPDGPGRAATTREHTRTRDVAAAVAADPGGIAVVSLAGAGDARALPLVSSCGLETAATPLTLKAEDYPLSQRIVAYDRGGAQSAMLRDFLAYLSAEDIDGPVRGSGFVDLGVERAPLAGEVDRIDFGLPRVRDDDQRARIEDLRVLMTGAERLSTVFRFDSASARLDLRAQRDLGRVIAHVAQSGDTRLHVVGFADAVGGFSPNETLSGRRARIVAEALREADAQGLLAEVEITETGAGRLLPVACNEAADGRARNRRVEIWVIP